MSNVASVYLADILALHHVSHDLVSVLLKDTTPALFLEGTNVGILFLLGLCLLLTLAKEVGRVLDGLTDSLPGGRVIFHRRGPDGLNGTNLAACLCSGRNRFGLAHFVMVDGPVSYTHLTLPTILLV